MSELTVYDAAGATVLERSTDQARIRDVLAGLGARFERWQASEPLTADAAADEVIEAYRESIDRLMQEYGFQSVDVISLTPDHPDKEALRKKFLSEHTHSDFEVRFFVHGRGLFYIHGGDKVYAVLCEQGDLISVPAGTPHWFDMGPRPDFKCIRLFTTPDGWAADYTGDAIADRFPRFGE
jgi:1,2-dihydroxy-3-keto-5-methylthiopentene dioxygenase